ncbi:MAG: S8 family peptidase [Epulopiscium sp.]|nr:S8 family peptidase [Candidatus Epulonipiscium sp.]
MDTAREAVGVEQVQRRGYKGTGIGVAVLDSGIYPHDDFTYQRNRIVAFKDFLHGYQMPYDDHYHGTHVAGIIGGDGYRSNGKYRGIAPGCHLIGVKILDEKGKGNTSDVLAGIQWVIDNKQRYNIRIANLSIGTDPKEGEDSPLVKAVHAAWDAGIIVVVAAGNNGPNPQSITVPGVGRKVITVGASDDHDTVQIHGDTITDYSGRGPTKACIKKPDVVAPGSKIMSCDTRKEYVPSSVTASAFNGNSGYRESSGTSMSTPIVTGAIALLLERYPRLTPNDVKLRLKQGTADLTYPQAQQGWGLIQIQKLILGGGES